MWNYEKRLEYPVNITTPNPKIAQIIMSQYGGPDGEMGASMRYLSQRFTAPNRIVAGVLNDVGTEELAHLEMVSTIVHQLTCNLSLEEIQNSGFANYYVDHTAGIWPQAAGGVPFNSCEFQSKGDPLTDLSEDLAAEQKARQMEQERDAARAERERIRGALTHARTRAEKAEKQAREQQAENSRLKAVESQIRSETERQQRIARQLAEMNQKARQELRKTRKQLEHLKGYLDKAEQQRLQEELELQEQDGFELE